MGGTPLSSLSGSLTTSLDQPDPGPFRLSCLRSQNAAGLPSRTGGPARRPWSRVYRACSKRILTNGSLPLGRISSLLLEAPDPKVSIRQDAGVNTMGPSLRGLDVDRHSKHGTRALGPCLQLRQGQVGAQALGMPGHHQLRFTPHCPTHYDGQHSIGLREGWLAWGGLGHWPRPCVLQLLQPQRVRQGGHHLAATSAAAAGGCPPPGGPPGLQVLVLLGAKAAAVVLEVLVAGKALGAAGTAELVVACVGALVLGEVGTATEGLAAQGALVELHAWGARGRQ